MIFSNLLDYDDWGLMIILVWCLPLRWCNKTEDVLYNCTVLSSTEMLCTVAMAMAIVSSANLTRSFPAKHQPLAEPHCHSLVWQSVDNSWTHVSHTRVSFRAGSPSYLTSPLSLFIWNYNNKTKKFKHSDKKSEFAITTLQQSCYDGLVGSRQLHCNKIYLERVKCKSVL